MNYVNIGGPIALGILGAVLAFAVSDIIEGVDLTAIGYILIVGALIWLLLGLVFNSRGRSVSTAEHRTQTPTGEHIERETREG